MGLGLFHDIPWELWFSLSFSTYFVVAAFGVFLKNHRSTLQHNAGNRPGRSLFTVQPSDVEETSANDASGSQGSSVEDTSMNRALSPEYGVFRYPMVSFFIRLGLSLNLTALVLGVLFLVIDMQQETYISEAYFITTVSFWNLILAYMVLALLAFSFSRAQKCVANRVFRLVDFGQYHGNVMVTSTNRGAMAAIVAHFASLCSVVTIDPWESAYVPFSSQTAKENMVREGVSDRVQVVDADPRNMPHDDCTFDWVVCPRVMWFVFPVDDHEAILSECRRVLRPGGKLLSFYSSSDVASLAESAGFVNISDSWYISLPWPSKYFVAERRVGSIRSSAGPLPRQFNFRFQSKRVIHPNPDLAKDEGNRNEFMKGFLVFLWSLGFMSLFVLVIGYIWAIFTYWEGMCFPCSGPYAHRMNYGLVVPTVPLVVAIQTEGMVTLLRQIRTQAVARVFDLVWRFLFMTCSSIAVSVMISMLWWGIELMCFWLPEVVPWVDPRAANIVALFVLSMFCLVIFLQQYDVPWERSESDQDIDGDCKDSKEPLLKAKKRRKI